MDEKISPLNQIVSLSFAHIAAKCGMLAAQLNLHNIVTNEPKKIDDIARVLNLKKFGAIKFFRVLDAFDLLKYDGEYIVASELTPHLGYFLGAHLLDGYKAIDELKYSLEHDDSCWRKVYGLNFYQYLQQHPEKYSQFEAWCQRTAKIWLRSVLDANDFSRFNTIIDVGGGHGDLLVRILEVNPSSNGILFDLPMVVKQAEISCESTQYKNKIKFIGGDFFVEVPSGGDAYIICRTLINWSDEKAIEIINKCYNAMLPGATLIILDFVLPNASHSSYKRAVLSDLNLYALVNGSNRTKQEWLDLMSNSCFKSCSFSVFDPLEQNDLIMPICVIEAAK